ncbi:MAG: hypothetical protein E7184_01980 [Erysipelotrichaceae bacterium]|nr:hypothetical protein [Erysipelotrichaceae bacterium]
MNIINLNKIIVLNNIKDLINISVSENVSYLRRCDGVSCNGQILINGVYENINGIEKIFSDSIDIENLIPYENIESLEDFSIVVDDFEYALVDEKLEMLVKLKINSFREVENNFLAQDNEKEILEEPANELEREIEEKSFLSQFLDSKKYERASTFYVYKNENSLEQIKEKYNVSLDEVDQNELREGDLINIPLKHE